MEGGSNFLCVDSQESIEKHYWKIPFLDSSREKLKLFYGFWRKHAVSLQPVPLILVKETRKTGRLETLWVKPVQVSSRKSPVSVSVHYLFIFRNKTDSVPRSNKLSRIFCRTKKGMENRENDLIYPDTYLQNSSYTIRIDAYRVIHKWFAKIQNRVVSKVWL